MHKMFHDEQADAEIISAACWGQCVSSTFGFGHCYENQVWIANQLT